MNLKPDVLIIGAGISGIMCALKCQEYDIDFMLIEKDSRAGGRLGSIYEEVMYSILDFKYSIHPTLLQKLFWI